MFSLAKVIDRGRFLGSKSGPSARFATPFLRLFAVLSDPNSKNAIGRPQRAVVTIIQCRRAVLPHIFVKYVLPQMREWFGGEMSAVIIQHRADARGGNKRLTSLKQGTDGLELVRKFTEEGRYEGAEIIPHEIVHKPYPSIPSFHLGVKAALERNADFHLWLEDDALVIDPKCGRWNELLDNREVGVYNTFHALNPAYMLTRRSFDQRIEPRLAQYKKWRESSRVEVWLREQMRTSRAYFDRSYAIRHHYHAYPYAGLRYVAERVREVAPEAAHLLDLDFGPGTSELPPITQEELMAHYEKDRRKKFMDRLRGFKADVVESYYHARGR